MVVHLRVIEGSGKEIQQTVRHGLVVGNKAGHRGVVRNFRFGLFPAPPNALGIGAVGVS